MASDNLLLVHGRIGTLDIYTVAMMIWGLALYLRGRPLLAGVALAVAAAFKLVAPYALAVLVLVELARVIARWRDRASPADWQPASGAAAPARSASSPAPGCSWACSASWT